MVRVLQGPEQAAQPIKTRRKQGGGATGQSREKEGRWGWAIVLVAPACPVSLAGPNTQWLAVARPGPKVPVVKTDFHVLRGGRAGEDSLQASQGCLY
ncbi:hypothetical protein E2C01_066810 [Portunus trituberculatus]|uniref:Uncharacterized protein n=1 Tax=Portunus trituberculatus TaxID=210409 RepID=A0A5B7HI51_PORTR|nr:hypothetical protein [Portunus trituberculatus]